MNTKTRKAKQREALVIEMPLDGFTPDKLDNLRKLVESKETLIKKALGAEKLPIETTDSTVRFPWFLADIDGDTVTAYTQFITSLCDTAKKKTRVTARPQEAFENEKFTMRVWLIGLGLVGEEYSLCRKLLSKNLSGDSSWRYTKPEKGAPRPSRETVHRDVISIRLTPDTLEKLAILASQKEGRTSRNMLIETIIEDYVRAAFPAREAAEPADPAVTPNPAEAAPEVE